MECKYGMYYSTFLKKMRVGKNITLKQLGWGICPASAKIYPKTAYYLCLELMKRPKEDWDCDRLFQISCNAVEILRSAGRMYYLSELFEIEEQVLALLVEKHETSLHIRICAVSQANLRFSCRGKSEIAAGNIEGLMFTLTQVRKWRKVLTEVYQDGGVSEKMENDCYLYWQTQNYCYGDVVRKRRKMLGMSVEELCTGIHMRHLCAISEEQKLYTKRELQKCIQLARLCSNAVQEVFYLNKLKSIET